MRLLPAEVRCVQLEHESGRTQAAERLVIEPSIASDSAR
jgi:hypothetical protein